jgi:hypothetical protein
MRKRMREGRRFDALGHVEVEAAGRLANALRLAVAEVLSVFGRACGREVLGGHCNHDRFLLFGVEELDLARLEQVVPRVVVLVVGRKRLVLRLLESADVVLGDDELLLLRDDEERSTDAASVRVEPELLLTDIADDRDLRLDVGTPAQADEVFRELVGVAVDADPDAIDEDLGCRRRAGVLLELLETPLVEELLDRGRVGADRDVRHEREVLDKTARLTFGRLGRADHAPVRVVQLARLGNLAVAADRRVAPPQMRQRRGKRVAVQDLRDTRPGLHRLLLVAPVAGRERILETVRDGRRPDGRVQLERLARLDALSTGGRGEGVNAEQRKPRATETWRQAHLLQVPVDVLRELLEEHAEEAGEERAGEVEALLAEVIAVVELAPLERGEQEPVDHVAKEVGLLGLEALIG